jgi:hypothetical protein
MKKQVKKNPVEETGLVPIVNSAAVSTIIKTEITQNDIIAITISRAENKLQKESRDLEKQLKGIKEKISKGQTESKRILAELEKKLISSKMISDAVNAKIKWLESMRDYSEPSRNTIVTTKDHEVDVNWYAYDKYDRRQEEGVLWYSISSNIIGSSRRFKMPVPNEIAKINEEEKELLKQVSDITELIIETRTKMASLPALERQARASIAIGALEATPEGRAILQRIESITIE